MNTILSLFGYVILGSALGLLTSFVDQELFDGFPVAFCLLLSGLGALLLITPLI